MIARLDEASLPYGKRRVLHDRCVYQRANVRKRVQLVPDPRKLLAAERGKLRLDRRKLLCRLRHRAQVSGVRCPINDTGDQPFQVQHTRERLRQLPPIHHTLVKLRHRRLPAVDMIGIFERLIEKFPKQPCPRRRLGPVEHPEQRPLLFGAPHRFAKLKAAARVDVDLKILAVLVVIQNAKVPERIFLRLLHIGKQSAERAQRRIVRIAEFLRKIGKMLSYPAHSVLGRKTRFFILIDDRREPVPQEVRRRADLVGGGVDKKLARRIGAELPDEPRHTVLALEEGRRHMSRRNIRKRGAENVSAHIDRANVIVLLLVQQRGLRKRPRGNHADDVALDDPLGERRILKLLADGDLISASDKLADVALDGMIRNTAHRRTFLFPAVPARQREVQLSRGDLGIVKEHFVKVPEPVHEDILAVFVLDFKILLHHWRHVYSLAFLSLSRHPAGQNPRSFLTSAPLR